MYQLRILLQSFISAAAFSSCDPGWLSQLSDWLWVDDCGSILGRSRDFSLRLQCSDRRWAHPVSKRVVPVRGEV